MSQLNLILAAMLLAACQPNKSTEQQATPPETRSTTLAVPAPPVDRTAEQLTDPQVGDVLVVRFFPNGGAQEQFYFYRVFRVTSDSVYTNPARQPATLADADVRSMNTFAAQAVRAYSRRELIEYQKEDSNDPQHSKLIKVRRGE